MQRAIWWKAFIYRQIVLSIDSTQRIVTIDPMTNFALNTNYYILVDAGAFVNTSNGVGYAGINSASSWNFRTVAAVDVTRPTPTGLVPAASPVAVTTPVIITFDEPVYAASGNIQLNSAEDNRTIAVTSNAVRGSGTNQIVIQPPAALAAKHNIFCYNPEYSLSGCVREFL